MQNYNSSSGFTLIELVVAMVIVGVISTLLIIYIMASTETFISIQSRKSLNIDAASSIRLFTREVSLTNKIYTALEKNIQFSSTIDTNMIIDYFINNDGTFTRKRGAGNIEIVSKNVDFNSSYFNYYDINDNIGTPIRRIRLSLLLRINNDSSRFTADIFPETYKNE